ncbi:MAG: hypothetical protein ACETWQ_09615 [Phycisphaerae bacterium]
MLTVCSKYKSARGPFRTYDLVSCLGEDGFHNWQVLVHIDLNV